MSRCIIHVGMHKTGSTSIQKSFHGFSDGEFVYYQDHKGRSNHAAVIFSLAGSKGSDRPIFRNVKYSRDLSEDQKSDIGYVHDSLNQAFRTLGDRSLIISAEGGMFLSTDELERLAGCIQDKVDEVTVVAYVRPPAAYMSSLCQEVLKSSAIEFNPESFYCNFKKYFGKFDEVFGRENVRLWKFDPRTFPNGCVVQDFCARLNINFPAERIVHFNESLSREALSLLFTYHRLDKSSDSKPQSNAHHQLVTKLAGIGKTKFRLSPDIVRPVLERNRSDIAWMEARLGASLDEDLGEYRPGDVRDEADLLKPDPFAVKELLALLGNGAPPGISGETLQEVALLVDSLLPGPKNRANVRIGRIIRAEPTLVSGWAIGAEPEKPVRVALLLNGKEIARTVADKMRPVLQNNGIHPTGRCGFVFRFNSGQDLQIGDQVAVQPVDEAFELQNSPSVVIEAATEATG